MPASDEYTSTTNYSLKKPIDGQAQDAWGLMINEDLDTLDTTLDTMQTDIDSKAPASNPTFTGTITAPDDSISGDAINGGTISNFASTGIDDNLPSGGPALTIDSNGNVGIGATNPDELLHVSGDVAEVKLTNTNPIEASGGTEQVFKIGVEGQKNNQYGSAGSIIFRQDGTWSSADALYKPTAIEFCTQDIGSTDNSETPRMRIDSSGNVELKTASAKLILPTGGGISFENHSTSTATGASSTASANVLDDYEEGTWTPVASDADSGGNTGTWSVSESTYTKIGNLVTVFLNVNNLNTTPVSPGMTPTNSLYITGLPFVSNSTALGSVSGRFTAGTEIHQNVIVPYGVSYALIQNQNDASNETFKTVDDFNSGADDIIVTLTYQTNS